MITGIITARREAMLRVTLRDASGQTYDYDAIIDTGYSGYFTLPPAVIAALGLQWYRLGNAELADGSESAFDVYEGILEWDGQETPILIDEMDSVSLIGMSLMAGYELNLPVRSGAMFTLRPILTP